MKLVEVRRLLAQERGSTCVVTTARGQRCAYSARRAAVIEQEHGHRFKVLVCRIHLQSMNRASGEELAEMEFKL